MLNFIPLFLPRKKINPRKNIDFSTILFLFRFFFSFLYQSILVQLPFNSRTLLIHSCSSHATIRVLLNLISILTFQRHKGNILRKSRCTSLRLASSFVWLRKNICFEQNIWIRVYYTKSIRVGLIRKTGCQKYHDTLHTMGILVVQSFQ